MGNLKLRRKTAYNLTPTQIVELWLDLEGGFKWEKVGPNDLANADADFTEALEKQRWCQRVCEAATERTRKSAERTQRLLLIVNMMVFHGEIGTKYWSKQLTNYLEEWKDEVTKSAEAIEPPKEVETE